MNKRYFALILLAFSIVCLIGGVKIAIDNPPFTGPGLMPTLVSAVMVLCSAGEVIFPVKDTEKKELLPAGKLLIALGFIVFLCLFLWLGFNFYIAAGVFLMGFMCCLAKGKYVRNLIVTIAALVLIYLIFTLGLDISFS